MLVLAAAISPTSVNVLVVGFFSTKILTITVIKDKKNHTSLSDKHVSLPSHPSEHCDTILLSSSVCSE